MKQSLLVISLSLLSFLGGFGVRLSSQAEKIQSINENGLVGGAPSAPPQCPQQDDFPKLIEDKYVTKFNGVKLELYYGFPPASDDIPFYIDQAKVIGLEDGGLLVNLADTLYKLDAQRRVVWTYPTTQMIIDYAYVNSTNLIYGTAGDNIMFVLDATTGRLHTGESRNGSGAFGVAQKYGKDMGLVTDNLIVYRERARQAGIEPMKDGISCWRGTTKLWNLAFPPDAELVVRGKRILAVTKSKNGIYVNEITPPPSKSE